MLLHASALSFTPTHQSENNHENRPKHITLQTIRIADITDNTANYDTICSSLSLYTYCYDNTQHNKAIDSIVKADGGINIYQNEDEINIGHLNKQNYKALSARTKTCI